MNSLLKRGISAYRIFLKNKLAMSIMMLFSGIMMFIAAINGKGNDTVMMPLGITLAGLAFSFWAFYRIGYIKSNMDKLESSDEKKIEKSVLILQIVEAVIYCIVVALGVFLLINQSFMNQVLNLMAGGFTTLNGVIGTTYLIKNRFRRNYWYYFKIVLTLFELGFGLFFVINSYSIEIGWFVAMGVLTSIAGVIEVSSALSQDSLKQTVQDGKDIVRILKKR